MTALFIVKLGQQRAADELEKITLNFQSNLGAEELETYIEWTFLAKRNSKKSLFSL